VKIELKDVLQSCGPCVKFAVAEITITAMLIQGSTYFAHGQPKLAR
jgi:hypothetical protein